MKIVFVKHILPKAGSGVWMSIFIALLVIGLVKKFFWVLAAFVYLWFLAAAPTATLGWTVMVAGALVFEQLMKIPVKFAIPLAVAVMVAAWVIVSRLKKPTEADQKSLQIAHTPDKQITDQ